MLERGRVRVNGEICKLANKILNPSDRVEVGEKRLVTEPFHGIKIVHEDPDLLVILKPAGLLTVATLHEKERTAYNYLREYLKTAGERVFIVHRLDKFVSGLLVFAKSESIKESLQAQFQRHTIERRYWAIVEGKVEKDSGTIESRLAQDHTKRMHSTEKPESGKKAVTHYRVLRRFSNLTALEVQLETGRKNQIRVHLSEMGNPIVGDESYGSTLNPIKRMGLHAFCLGFVHPTTRTNLHFKSDPPPEFQKYLPVNNQE
jgi:23S rRNA pseudouridine1911/1915/1917 synthase